MSRILIVDDERGSRESLRLVFSREFTVLLAATAREALDALAREPIDLVLLDVILPGSSGIDVLRQIHASYPGLPVIMVSASTAIPPVVEAIRLGALDFVNKPFDVETLRHAVRRALETSRLQRQVAALATDLSRTYPTQEIVGCNPAFVAALDHIRHAAATDATVLIQGESGTGKELAARLLHALSPRHDEPFVAVHCASLPESLMESELFGHEKGAFTSADRMKPGRFDLAGAGTLFFDEVGEMSPATQAKILRVVQEREFMRVGGTRVIRTSARLVSATARDLRRDATDGRFRGDLYYRLGVVPVMLPPLRDDIPLLVGHFVAHFGPALRARATRFDDAALARLCAYDWPGNVRELRNIVERVLVLHGRDETIGSACLPEEFHAAIRISAAPAPAIPPPVAPPAAPPPPTAAPETLASAVDACERRMILDALLLSRGVQARAAERLGTTRRILRYKMEKLGIGPDTADPVVP